MSQTTNSILMIRPINFRMNEQTAVNNYFQEDLSLRDSLINLKAQKEFDDYVDKLRKFIVRRIKCRQAWPIIESNYNRSIQHDILSYLMTEKIQNECLWDYKYTTYSNLRKEMEVWSLYSAFKLKIILRKASKKIAKLFERYQKMKKNEELQEKYQELEKKYQKLKKLGNKNKVYQLYKRLEKIRSYMKWKDNGKSFFEKMDDSIHEISYPQIIFEYVDYLNDKVEKKKNAKLDDSNLNVVKSVNKCQKSQFRKKPHQCQKSYPKPHNKSNGFQRLGMRKR